MTYVDHGNGKDEVREPAKFVGQVWIKRADAFGRGNSNTLFEVTVRSDTEKGLIQKLADQLATYSE